MGPASAMCAVREDSLQLVSLRISQCGGVDETIWMVE